MLRRPLHSCVVYALLTLGLGPSCCTAPPSPTGASDPLPKSRDVITQWNDRAARMSRLWGRVAVTFRFTDQDGNRRFEQGEGHFQRRDGSDLALSVGKLSDVMLWIGADDTQYWLIERFDSRRVLYGAHEAYTNEKGRRLGLPVEPHNLLVLMGIGQFDEHTSNTVERGKDNSIVLTVSDIESNETHSGAWRATLDSGTLLPIMVERLDADGEATLRAEHTGVTPTIVRYEQSSSVDQMAEAIRVSYPSEDASITINFDAELTDSSRSGKIQDAAFDLDVLISLLGPMEEIIDLDTHAPSRPAPGSNQ